MEGTIALFSRGVAVTVSKLQASPAEPRSCGRKCRRKHANWRSSAEWVELRDSNSTLQQGSISRKLTRKVIPLKGAPSDDLFVAQDAGISGDHQFIAHDATSGETASPAYVVASVTPSDVPVDNSAAAHSAPHPETTPYAGATSAAPAAGREVTAEGPLTSTLSPPGEAYPLLPSIDAGDGSFESIVEESRTEPAEELGSRLNGASSGQFPVQAVLSDVTEAQGAGFDVTKDGEQARAEAGATAAERDPLDWVSQGVAASAATMAETAVAATLVQRKLREAERGGVTPRKKEGGRPQKSPFRRADTVKLESGPFDQAEELAVSGSLREASQGTRAESNSGEAIVEEVFSRFPEERNGAATSNGALSESDFSDMSDTETWSLEEKQRVKAWKKARRRSLARKIMRGDTVRKALGIPEPGEGRRRAMFRERSAQVRQQMHRAVKTAQQSPLADALSTAFFILFPLTIGAVVYTVVGHAISRLEPLISPAPQPDTITWWHQITDSWQKWMMSGQAAGAAGVLSGFAGVGIAAKTAAPAAALMTSSVSEMDTLWRSFGGASLVALYWKTLVFGKTFRAIEWDLTSHDVPEGPMHSVAIRVPSLYAVKTKIALEAGLEDPSSIEQLALWIPGSGDFVEPIEQAKDLTLVPELGFIVWTVTPKAQMPFPSRAYPRAPKPKSPAEALSEACQTAAMIEAVILGFDEGWGGPSTAVSAEEKAISDEGSSSEPQNGSLMGVNSFQATSRSTEESRVTPMTAEERDGLVNLVAREDKGLQILFQAFGSGPRFVHHALYYARSKGTEQGRQNSG